MICDKRSNKDEKYLKKEESFDILKLLGSIKNMEE